MPHVFSRRAIVIAIAAAVTPRAFAAGVAEQVRAVIEAQLHAFAEDDADAAFDTATPQVRSAIGHAGYFLAMVRGHYPMVYGATTVAFLDIEVEGRDAWQMTRITDAQGHDWLALFRLERQPDGGWRIAGCNVEEAHTPA